MYTYTIQPRRVNTLRPRQKGRHFADDIFKCIFLNEHVWIPIKISLKFVPKDPINNIPALVQIMAWRRPGDKPLSESMMVNLPTHICVTRPQWVNITPASNFVLFNHHSMTNICPVFHRCFKKHGIIAFQHILQMSSNIPPRWHPFHMDIIFTHLIFRHPARLRHFDWRRDMPVITKVTLLFSCFMGSD